MRCGTDRWNLCKSAGVKLRLISVGGILYVVYKLRGHLDHHFALFLFRADGLLAAIFRVGNQNRKGVQRRFERVHTQWWIGIIRIPVHALADGVQLLEEIGVRNFLEAEHGLDFRYLWHRFSFL